MKLSEILAVERINCTLSVASKKKALEELSGLLAQGTTELTGNEVFTALVAREKLGSTGLGRGIAIPHGRMPGITNCIGAFTHLQHAVDYDAHDGQGIDMMFGLLVPQEASEEHLKYLSAIAAMFSDEARCTALREATDSAAALALLVSGDD